MQTEDVEGVPQTTNVASQTGPIPFASDTRRLIAAFADGLMYLAFVSASLVVLFPVLEALPPFHFVQFLAPIVLTVTFWAAMSWLEQSRVKGSPGKLACGIAVISLHGEPITFRQALLRNSTKTLYAVGLGITVSLGTHLKSMSMVETFIFFGYLLVYVFIVAMTGEIVG